MLGLSWSQISIIVLVGVFVLGPERIPTAVTWAITNLHRARTMASGAQAELQRELGPELAELRRQVADLQSLKEIQELRDLHPRRLLSKNLLGDEFSHGLTGFLGLDAQTVPSAPTPMNTETAKTGSRSGPSDAPASTQVHAQSGKGQQPSPQGKTITIDESRPAQPNTAVLVGAPAPYDNDAT